MGSAAPRDPESPWPGKPEISRFREDQRKRIKRLHECGELDPAAWASGLSKLRELKRAMQSGLETAQRTQYGGVAHFQVDVHVFDAAHSVYMGRLRCFGERPTQGRLEWRAPACGAQPFLRQCEDFACDWRRFEETPKVILFDRKSGFVLRPRLEEAIPPGYELRPVDEDDLDDGAPF